ncbi:MAG: hypothetical protein MUC73_02085, partial [Cyclobacteriaceae bacterium]|nr:hypothetical protein [Cyclobacteriaceae bacterium]
MNLQVIKNRVLYWLKVTVVYGLFLIIFFLISSFLLLQIPAVQSSLAKRFLKSFSVSTDFQTSINRMEFYWFDRLIIEGLTVEDPEENIMIGVDRLSVNFSFSGIFQDKDINLDATVLEGASVYLKTIQDGDSVRDLNINVFVSRINAMSKSGGGGGGAKISIGEAILKNSHFAMHTDRDTVSGMFDPNHFSLTIPDASLNRFMILGDTIEFNLDNLSAKEEKLDFSILNLSTFFRISQAGMEFRGIHLQAGESIISDTVLFTYSSQAALSTFIDSVSIEAHLDNSILNPNDLRLFFPIPEDIRTSVELSGDFNGRISKFRFQNMDLKKGNTRLQGTLEMDGIPNLDETFILLSLKESNIDFKDLDFIFNEKTLSRLTPLGQLNFRGQFLGYPTDFVAAGSFISSIGRITSDINLKINEESIDLSEYKGRLTLSDFDLGLYLNDTIRFQKVNMNGTLTGKGLTLQSANFTLVGEVSSIGLLGYNYTNIQTNARFASEYFNGKLQIQDPNLKLNVEGSVDLRKNLNRIQIRGLLDSAYLHNLNLVPTYTFLHSEMDIDIQGLVLDSLRGTAQLRTIEAQYDDESIELNNITLSAERSKLERQIVLNTSLFDAEVKGDFYFSNLFKDLPALIKEFRLNIENDSSEIQNYYTSKRGKIPNRYAADFKFNLKNMKSILDFLDIDVG